MKSTINPRHRTYTNNKFERPFSPRFAIHVTMRSEIAVGGLSLLEPRARQWLESYVPTLAQRLQIALYHWSINSNHLHFVLKAQERKSFQSFLRTVANRTARFVLDAEKGRGKQLRFWANRPYSRLLTWGRELKNVLRYVERNVKEAMGEMRYTSRQDKSRMQQTNQELDRQIRTRTTQLELRL